jgi:sulfhydrogenase subunit alpha
MNESVLNHFICKIEGHGNLKLNYKKGTVELNIDEGERLFEQLVLNRPYEDAPFITARICGICPTAHTIASVKAIEDAFGVKTTPNIESLRKVLMAGQIIQSHALHLYFLAAPDYLNVVNALELHEKNPRAYQTAVSLKKLGDKIIEKIGGRAVHPTTPCVGGFHSAPGKAELRELINELESSLAMALETAELFANFKYPKLEKVTEYMTTQKNGKLNYIDSDTIVTNKNFKTNLDNYEYAFTEVTRDGSQTKYGLKDGHGFMVGALARLTLDSKSLHPKAAYAFNKIWNHDLPSNNSFHNNVAQAIELIHLIEECVIELNKVILDKNEVFRVPFKVKESSGVAVVEAPRGSLYHAVKLDETGKILIYDIITPTVQNLVNIEEDAAWLMENRGKKTEDQVFKEIEMLIRAYDPCITCAVH